jgi:hypothetical protein
MLRCPALAVALLICLMPMSTLMAQPVHVEVVQTQNEGWQLLVDGQPYRIRGAGGNHSLTDLAAAGGNTTRTWGVGEQTRAYLDEAHRHGIRVIVGIWLGHPRHGFDYSDIEQVRAQYTHVRESVESLKDHPAVLMWSLGNEMEHGDGESNAALWSHLQACAALVKDLDPHHPVATVFAEISETKIAAVQTLCPDIDVIGFNSYGGAPTVPVRYREAGGRLPYIVTEFGPLGTWEVRKDAHGMVMEPTSTQKAETYERAYLALDGDEAMCLGSLAFLWSHKQEATHTWFGMWLEDGSKVAAVDTMTRLWSGREPENRCPVIEPIEAVGGTSERAGARLSFALSVSDPDGDPLTAIWELHREAGEYVTGGDYQARPGRVDEAMLEGDLEHAVIELPREPGRYRLYVTVHDGRGGAATANVPLYVSGS